MLTDLEKLTELARIATEIITKPNERESRITTRQKGINVYLTSPSNPTTPTKLGGDLIEISYTYGNGTDSITWHIFNTEAGGRLWALRKQNEICKMSWQGDSPFLVIPAENYGEMANVYLSFDKDIIAN